MTRVKICGITSLEDALCAVEAGAHALGFIFYSQSPRHVSIPMAANICTALPPFISRVGVFVNEQEYTIEKALNDCGLDTLQFHGDEPPGFCQKFPAKSIKAFHLQQPGELQLLREYDVDAWLLDTSTQDARGGTGTPCDWNLASQAAAMGTPLILSGGLGPDNVSEAIQRVSPYAVDANSCLEISPGKKDHRKIRDFMARIH